MRFSIRPVTLAIVLCSQLGFTLQAGAPVFMFSGFGLDNDTTMVNGLLKSKSLTIVNFGTAPLNVSSATISGSEFTFTPSFPIPVPASIPPNGTLGPFVVVFSPSGPGVRTGQILVQDDAPGNPHAIPLQGFGVAVASGDFAILAQNNIPLATSVAAGGTATYRLVVTGSPNTITLKCSGAPQGAGCNVQPSVTLGTPSILGSDSSEIFPVSISTTGTGQIGSLRPPLSALWSSLAIAFGLALATGFKRGARVALLMLCVAVLAGVVACGGGASKVTNSVSTVSTPPGTYTLTLTATGNGGTGTVHTVPITLVVRPSGSP
ncbi:MAG TPA: hypothetical protein VFP11_09305 [Candidatus Angelobacter sp.]|nr:hypothetical protein [Candidatus Angelobacter sp.]